MKLKEAEGEGVKEAMQPPGRSSVVSTEASSSSSTYPATKLASKATNPPMSTIVDVDAARPPGSADFTLGSVKRSIASLLLHDDAAELLEMTLKPKSEVIGGISALGVDLKHFTK